MANNDDIIKQLRAEVDEKNRLLKEKDKEMAKALEEKDKEMAKALEEKDKELIMLRYEVFMEERKLLSRCIRRCCLSR
jgi:tRNA A37 N6-isopentenylltransferase MiaA